MNSARRQARTLGYCSDRQTEGLACAWMLFLGAAGSKVSPAKRDGGADVFSPKFVAEAAMEPQMIEGVRYARAG